jgi:hypothetical protein
VPDLRRPAARPPSPSSSRRERAHRAAAGESWASPLAARCSGSSPQVIVARLSVAGLGAVRLRQLRRRSQPATLTPDLAELRDAVAPRAAVHVTRT